MINIKVNMDTMEIIVQGHAFSNPKGQDIICSAVSTLTETLSVYLEEKMKEGLLQDLHEEVRSGNVYINPQPYSWAANEIKTAIDVIRIGYMATAKTYSEYINYEEEE